ncbi:hypothetical protein AWE51_22300 [Aquimarina aggregata]|uniref:NAD-dependent epimerase/dehydratase domain-containing protein n=1 Tax=Aquimarina aggregata TaxID=1642818 RepID=A0A163BIJ2_9FLAO|nr:NAD-dependent epimerase/dehydratase family protein [Aquimarina aggregata]KZS41437.1 hypothetical protein AWE51_22300 [Aquimarina aggregata]
MKNIIVTGGAGFIGSHVVDKIVDSGLYKVIVIDNLLGSNFSPPFFKNEKVIYEYGDVSNYMQMKVVFEKYSPYYVIHLAANGNVPLSDVYPSVDFNSNALGSFNILNLSKDYNVKKVVYASTAAVYGEPIYTPIDEKHVLGPISNYGVSKLYGEQLARAYSKTYDLPFTAFRIFNTYGPRQPRYVLFDLIKKLKNDKENLEVLGTGAQIRDYAYVSDTAEVFFKALDNEKSNNNVYNIAGGNPISIKELVELICNVYEISPRINYTGKSWRGDINNLTANIERLKEDFDFNPQVNIHKGVRKTIEWFIENRNFIE